MAFTRILIFTLFVTLTLLETALTQFSNHPLQYNFQSNKITGKWYVLAMITTEPPEDIPTCMKIDVTENNNVFTFKIISRTSTGRRRPPMVIQVNNTNSHGSTPGYRYNVSLGDFLDYFSPDYYEAVIKYRRDSLTYLILSRDRNLTPG
ncbi:hypothetical protein PV325_009962, partial [Microctonus aethiopoides]